MPRPEAVIVVGLGEEGTLRATGLALDGSAGHIAYAQRVRERAAGGSTTFELAATLIGSGGISMQVGTAAQAIAQGVAQANERLSARRVCGVALARGAEASVDRALSRPGDRGCITR